MRSKQWFIVLFASIIAGCSLNTVDECPIWLDVNDTDFYSADNDADGDKTNNCWDVCPYNNQVNAFYTKEMVMAHPIDASEWVYVCNLNVPISESDFSSSFAFNEEYNIYHVYKASDIELYRNLAESERSQIKGIIFHNAINLAEDVESCNDLEWSPIPLPETGKFIIEGRDNAEITASDDDGTCVLSQPLFADFNHVHVNESNKVENKAELTINLNFTGKMNGGLTNHINESEIHHLTFNGTSHLEKNDQAEFGLLTGSITQSKLSDITILGKLETQRDNISNGKIGLLAGSVSNAELNEITCYGDVISNISDAENGSVGLLSGEITDSTLNQIKLTNPATDIHSDSDNDSDNDNDNQKVVKYDSSIQINAPIHTTGGLAGKLSRTTIKGGSLTGLSIETNANIDYMAGLAGFMEDSSFTAEEYVTNNIRLNSQKAKPIAVGGIAGTIINQNANDTTGIKQINTQITVSNAAFVGGFAGSIETAILSDITLRKVSVTQAANSVIEHIGGVIGNMSNQSRISRSSFDDTTLTVTHAEYIGGLAGSIYDESTVEGNSFSNMTIIDTRPDDNADNTEDDTEKIIHKTGYLGGVAGYAKDSRIITTSHNILNIESVASNYTGGIAGLLSNSRIAECGITGSSEKKKENEEKEESGDDNIIHVQSGEYISGFAGALIDGSEITGGTLSNMTITANMTITPEQTIITASDNTVYAGSLTGFSVGGFISGCSINHTTLNVAMSQGFIGGLAGYMYNAEIRGTKQSKINVIVTDTDNDNEGTSTEIQPLGEPSDMFQQMFESNDNKPTNDNKTRGGLEAVGGMAGRMDSSNIHSASLENYNILAENTYNVGGVIGFLYESELVSNEVKSDLITDVADQEEVYGIIRGKSYIGGIAGRVFNSNINNNNVSSNLIHGENYVGGLIGHLVTYGHKADTQEYSNIPFSSYIRSSNNLARRVEGVNHVGGYIGSLFNSYATPTISWNANQITQKVTATGELLGGFIGDIEYGCDDLVTISNINNNINTIETMSSENGDQITGGLIGQVKRNEGYNNCHIQTQLDPDTFLSINELTIPVNINGAHFDYTIKDDGVEVIKRILTQILNSIAESIVNSNVSDVISINSLRHEIQTLKGVDQVGGLIGHIEDHTVSNSNVAVLGMNMYIGYMTGEQKPGGLVGTIDHTLDESDPKDSDRKTFTVGSSNIIINFDKNKGDQYAEFISQMSGKVGMNFQCIYSFFPSMSTNESTLEHTIPLSNLSNDSFNIELDYIEGLPDNLIDAPAGEDASYETLKDTIYIEPKSVTILSESHKTGIKNKISAIIQNKLTNLTAPEIAQLSEKLGLSLTDAVALANKDYSVLANYNLMSIFTEQDEQDMLSDEYFKSSVRDLEVLLQLIRKGAYSYKSGDDDFYISSNYLTFGRLNRPSYYYSGLSKCVIQHLLSTPTNPEAYKKCLDAAQVPMNKAGVVMLYIDALNMVNNSICYYTDLGSIINMSGAIIQKDNNHEPLTEPIPLVFSIETPVLPLRSGENNDNTETNPETPDTPDTPVPGE